MEERAEELTIGRDGVIARGPRGMEIAREVERRREWMRLARAGLAAALLVALVGPGVDAMVVAAVSTAFARMAVAWRPRACSRKASRSNTSRRRVTLRRDF